jgi:hypothetical protein
MADKILTEDGFEILLEDDSGSLLKETSGSETAGAINITVGSVNDLSIGRNIFVG